MCGPSTTVASLETAHTAMILLSAGRGARGATTQATTKIRLDQLTIHRTGRSSLSLGMICVWATRDYLYFFEHEVDYIYNALTRGPHRCALSARSYLEPLLPRSISYLCCNASHHMQQAIPNLAMLRARVHVLTLVDGTDLDNGRLADSLASRPCYRAAPNTSHGPRPLVAPYSCACKVRV